MISGLIKFLTSIFGNKRERQLKEILPLVEQINEHFEDFCRTLSDEDLPKKTEEFRRRLSEGEAIDDVLPEAFALVKDACRRSVGKLWDVMGNPTEWDMIPYDVQLIGAIILHQGKIAEMATGEGKTLVATMPLYLNCLIGKGAHLITVNDYLAQRDSEWMGGVFELLGVTVGCIISKMNPSERKVAYGHDITYGTNNEFGFDYLRDNMAINSEDVAQRGHHYVIVDEVDSVLIDEARTPLIIAGPVAKDKSEDIYKELKPSVAKLVRAQLKRVIDIVKQAEKLLESESGEELFEAGRFILRAYRAFPKYKPLTKLLSETGVKSLMNQVENDYLRNKKLHELDEEFFYIIDEKQHTIDLTEEGREFLARHLGSDADLFLLPDLSEESHLIDSDDDLSDDEKAKAKDELNTTYAKRSEQIHTIGQLLRAYSLYEPDIDYVIQDDKVMIVDEFTGRLMSGRRYSDGLHQAIEAKEGVKIEGETQTIATITFQNYFRLYSKIAGMTGTAETEEAEFWDIYKLEVAVIPTNEPIKRADYEDVIYRTSHEKYEAILDEIELLYKDRLPILVGTTSVEVSEKLSKMLRHRDIPHDVLNAKHHQREADIVKYAGQPGSVTIATNMAGRGTDIKLGQGVVRWGEDAIGDKDQATGGLQIIGTERHESRRIDRQLRGRSGRQGDPGASIFYLSLEDDLMRLFGSERITKVMDRLGLNEGEVIAHPMISKSIGKAQKQVEGHHFSMRKHLLEYDDVMNQQREVVYKRRRAILFDEDIYGFIEATISEYIDNLLDEFAEDDSAPGFWDVDGFKVRLMRNLQIEPPKPEEWDKYSNADDWHQYLSEKALEIFDRRTALYGKEHFHPFVRYVVLRVIDQKWQDHLYDMDRLKEGVGLRAYGQKNPLIEYKKEGFDMFRSMLDSTSEEALRIVFHSGIKVPTEDHSIPSKKMQFVHESATAPMVGGDPRSQAARGQQKKQPHKKTGPTIGRNELCPCGSGKKYKRCCGA
ncbi:MAG: preprotein translocase subunit SecA [Candidatus Electryoneaceae bacterium]|nr:preprotein translocase subunit SecA [Candidatus Electryoneaceae bacterium]